MSSIEILLCDPSHFIFERGKIICKGLRYQRSSIGKEKNTLLNSRFPQAPNNLERSISFTCSGSHNKQDAILTVGNCFNCLVYSIHLIITRLLVGIIKIIRFVNNLVLERVNVILFMIHFPQCFGRRELIQRERNLDISLGDILIVKYKSVTV